MNKNDLDNKPPGFNDVLLAIFLKYIGLFLYGQLISAGFMVIIKQYDTAIKNDDLFIAVLSLSWAAICCGNAYLEYYKTKN